MLEKLSLDGRLWWGQTLVRNGFVIISLNLFENWYNEANTPQTFWKISRQIFQLFIHQCCRSQTRLLIQQPKQQHFRCVSCFRTMYVKQRNASEIMISEGPTPCPIHDHEEFPPQLTPTGNCTNESSRHTHVNAEARKLGKSKTVS